VKRGLAHPLATKSRQANTPRVKHPTHNITMSALLAELEQQACSIFPEERAHLAEIAYYNNAQANLGRRFTKTA